MTTNREREAARATVTIAGYRFVLNVDAYTVDAAIATTELDAELRAAKEAGAGPATAVFGARLLSLARLALQSSGHDWTDTEIVARLDLGAICDLVRHFIRVGMDDAAPVASPALGGAAPSRQALCQTISEYLAGHPTLTLARVLAMPYRRYSQLIAAMAADLPDPETAVGVAERIIQGI